MTYTLARTFQLLDQVAPLLPSHLRVEVERELLPALAAEIQSASHAGAPVCVFSPAPEPDCWCVGRPDAVRVIRAGRAQAALVAAWRAIRGDCPKCSDVAPGSAKGDPERAARRMVRDVAPAWASRHCPELAAAFGRILVRDGRLQYTPGGAVRVRTASAFVPRA